MLTLQEAKVHLRTDHDDDDDYIEDLILVAQEYIRDILTPLPDPDADPLDPPFVLPVTQKQKQVCRLLVAHWYANREAVSDAPKSEVPLAVRALLLLERPPEGLI